LKAGLRTWQDHLQRVQGLQEEADEETAAAESILAEVRADVEAVEADTSTDANTSAESAPAAGVVVTGADLQERLLQRQVSLSVVFRLLNVRRTFTRFSVTSFDVVEDEDGDEVVVDVGAAAAEEQPWVVGVERPRKSVSNASPRQLLLLLLLFPPQRGGR
jgi:hypothetical protein